MTYETVFTIKQIKDGKGYFSKYLSVRDYYAGEEGEAYWLGKGAEMLGISGEVQDEDFLAISNNRHPQTGGKLTQRSLQNNLHDITYSAPKAVSILAVMGEDERVIKAFEETVRYAHRLLEEQAAVRLRGGAYYNSEKVNFTRNMTTAVYIHDDSRALNPQLHAHLVSGNFSYDPAREKWYALQTRIMMEKANAEIRPQVNEFLKGRLVKLGYNTEIKAGELKIDFITDEMEKKLSERSMQREAFKTRYRDIFGEEPSKKRIEHFIKDGRKMARERFISEYQGQFGSRPDAEMVKAFVRDWREAKPEKVSKAERLERQLSKWNEDEKRRFYSGLEKSRKRSVSNTENPGLPEKVGNQEAEWAQETREKKKQGLKQTRKKAVKERSALKCRHDRARAYRSLQRGRALGLALRGHPHFAALYAFQNKAKNRRQRQ